VDVGDFEAQVIELFPALQPLGGAVTSPLPVLDQPVEDLDEGDVARREVMAEHAAVIVAERELDLEAELLRVERGQGLQLIGDEAQVGKLADHGSVPKT
jgi:hypothetical protein